MQISSLIITVVLAFGIQADLDFQEEYYFIHQEKSFSFDCDLANKIVFSEDGTYVREEDISYDFIDDNGNVELVLVKINELFGTWELRDSELVLNDKEIRKFTCKTTDDQVLDLNIVSSDLVFGSAEYLVDATILKIDEKEMYYINSDK